MKLDYKHRNSLYLRMFSGYSWYFISVRSYRFEMRTLNRFNSYLTTSTPLYSNNSRDFTTLICTENMHEIATHGSTHMRCIFSFFQLKNRLREPFLFSSSGPHWLIQLWIDLMRKQGHCKTSSDLHLFISSILVIYMPLDGAQKIVNKWR